MQTVSIQIRGALNTSLRFTRRIPVWDRLNICRKPHSIFSCLVGYFMGYMERWMPYRSEIAPTKVINLWEKFPHNFWISGVQWEKWFSCEGRIIQAAADRKRIGAGENIPPKFWASPLLCCGWKTVREIPCSGVKLNLNLRLHAKNPVNCRMCPFTLKKRKGTRAALDSM